MIKGLVVTVWIHYDSGFGYLIQGLALMMRDKAAEEKPKLAQI